MLSRTARGIPRFSITSDRRSSSTRRRSLPKFDRRLKAETTIAPFLRVIGVLAINSPFHLPEVYSSTPRASIRREVYGHGSQDLSPQPYCPPLSILLATLTPLSPFAYLAMPR